MASYVNKQAQYARMLAADGTALTETAGALDVNLASGSLAVSIDQSTDSVQIYGNDGGANRAILTDAAGHLQVDVLIADLPSGAATESSLASVDGKLPASIGQKAKAASLAVTLASDEDDVNIAAAQLPASLGAAAPGASLSVVQDTTGGWSVDSTLQNVPVAGSQNNAWNNASPAINGTSTAIDCQYSKEVDVFGKNTTGDGVLTLQLSQDNVTYYDSAYSVNVSAATDFHGHFCLGARYVRLKSSVGMTALYATVAAKA